MSASAERRTSTVKYRVTILCARNVAKQDFFRLPDPFARITVDGSGQCHTTRSLKGTIDPTWNQQYDLFVGNMESITISVWNQRKVHKGRGAGFLGCIRITPLAIQRLKDHGYQRLDLTAVNPAEHDYITGQVVVSIVTCEKVSNNVADMWGNIPSIMNTNMSTNDDDSDIPPGWDLRKTPNGRVQFVNNVTHAVQWQKPTRSAYDVQGEQSNVFVPINSCPTSLNGLDVSPTLNNDRKNNMDTSPLSDVNKDIQANGDSPMRAEQFSNESSKNEVSKKENSPDNCRLNCHWSSDESCSTCMLQLKNKKSSISQNGEGKKFSHSDRLRHYMNRTLLHREKSDNFERKKTPQGQVYFVNRATGQSTWHDPNIPKDAENIPNEELGPLPVGWEVRYTTNGRRYFVDHNNRTTQFADPRLVTHIPVAEQVDKKVYEKAVDKLEELPKYKRDLFQKLKVFRAELRALQTSSRHCRIEVSRKNIFEQSYRAIMKMKSRDLRKQLMIKFKNEDGLDYGGITREWLYLLSQEMFNGCYGLFQYSKDSQYTLEINPDSGINPEHLSYFHFVGRIVGMAVFHAHYLDGGFTMPFYKQMLGMENTLEDLQSVDPELYRGLNWLLENDITDTVYQTFSVEHRSFDQITKFNLKENGDSIPVDDSNKEEYVKLYVNYRLYHAVEPQLKAFFQGFHEVVPQYLIKMFDERELELLICGLGKIDIKDWKENTVFKHCTKDTNIIKWFWDVIQAYNEEQRARLLQFVTGSSRVPIQGFKALQGSGGSSGPRLFTINLVGNNCIALPKAHTCFNRLDLPNYQSKEILYEKLTRAVEETCGFTIE